MSRCANSVRFHVFRSCAGNLFLSIVVAENVCREPAFTLTLMEHMKNFSEGDLPISFGPPRLKARLLFTESDFPMGKKWEQQSRIPLHPTCNAPLGCWNFAAPASGKGPPRSPAAGGVEKRARLPPPTAPAPVCSARIGDVKKPETVEQASPLEELRWFLPFSCEESAPRSCGAQFVVISLAAPDRSSSVAKEETRTASSLSSGKRSRLTAPLDATGRARLGAWRSASVLSGVLCWGPLWGSECVFEKRGQKMTF